MKKVIAIGLIGFVFFADIYGMVFMWLPFLLRENASTNEKWAKFWDHLWKMTLLSVGVTTLVAWTGLEAIGTLYKAFELVSNLIVYWIVAPILLIKFAKAGFTFKSNSKDDDYGMV